MAPVPRLWLRSAEDSGGTSLGEWEHSTTTSAKAVAIVVATVVVVLFTPWSCRTRLYIQLK